ncbi:MAG: Glutamate racemase 2 [Deltaproteobacteria bacterium ADurb.Bin510]|nr:MAG: Glutamate racemase 2 [Deltaproteobacteria bacterium ADurb.Bin510]
MANIAIFDSGIGGLTFLKLARTRLPHENFIYYADTDNVPYGTRSLEEVRGLVENAADFLSRQDLKALVLACNTATSAAAEVLRQRYAFPILGMEPAVKPALSASGPKRVLLFSTSLTMRLGKLRQLIEELHGTDQVTTMAFDELVIAAESFDFDSPAVADLIKSKLAGLDLSEFGAVVLGCTHFIYFRPAFAAAVPGHIQIVDGNLGTLNNLVHTIEPLGLNSAGGSLSFYSSGRITEPERVRQLMNLL